MRQRAIFCPDAPTDRASEVSADQSVARSMRPSTTVQTLIRTKKVRTGSNEAEEHIVEEERSEEGEERSSEDSADSADESEEE